MPDTSGAAERPVDVPPWLTELAARDDPPTTIDDDLLARLARAGVEELLPAVGTVIVQNEQAAEATGIGVVGPGSRSSIRSKAGRHLSPPRSHGSSISSNASTSCGGSGSPQSICETPSTPAAR
jgi:hypothetical protein